MALADVLDEEFFATSWRKAPRLLRNASAHFLAVAPDHDTVDLWIEDAKRDDDTAVVREQGGHLQLLEGLSAPPLDAMIHDAQALFAWDDIWCDFVRTTRRASLGSHFDNSDNFVIQIEGIKKWRLAPRTDVPPEIVRLRLLGVPGLAEFPIRGDAWTCTARPGDVVYLPLCWPHHGVALSQSLSVTLAVNARVPAELVASAAFDVLAREPWASDAMPIGPGVDRDAVAKAALDGVIEQQAAIAAFMARGRRTQPN